MRSRNFSKQPNKKDGMKLHSYHTDSVEVAIRMAGIELGDEAILLGSKRAADKGPYEVTFAVVDPPKSAGDSQADSEAAAAETADSVGGTPEQPHADAGVKFPEPSVELEADTRAPAVTGPAATGPPSAIPRGGPAHWRTFVPPLLEVARGDRDDHGPSETILDDVSEKPEEDGSAVAVDLQERSADARRVEEAFSQAPQGSERSLSDTMAELTLSLNDLREWLRGQQALHDPLLLHQHERLDGPIRSALFAQLTRQGVQSRLAFQLLSGADTQGDDGPKLDQVRAVLEERLGEICPTDPSLGTRYSNVRIVALVGPPGVGKTSTLAKLAVRYGLAEGVPVHLVSADPLRVGIAEPLEAYARLLAVPLMRMTEPGTFCDEIQRAVQAFGPADRALFLIDTPGYGSTEWSAAESLAQGMLATPGIDIHLVLSLTTKPLDLRRVIERYRMFRPRKLLFTKLDETETFGAAVNEAARTQLPLSFFANGTRVPEDLSAARSSTLSQLLLQGNSLSPE